MHSLKCCILRGERQQSEAGSSRSPPQDFPGAGAGWEPLQGSPARGRDSSQEGKGLRGFLGGFPASRGTGMEQGDASSSASLGRIWWLCLQGQVPPLAPMGRTPQC